MVNTGPDQTTLQNLDFGLEICNAILHLLCHFIAIYSLLSMRSDKCDLRGHALCHRALVSFVCPPAKLWDHGVHYSSHSKT